MKKGDAIVLLGEPLVVHELHCRLPPAETACGRYVHFYYAANAARVVTDMVDCMACIASRGRPTLDDVLRQATKPVRTP